MQNDTNRLVLRAKIEKVLRSRGYDKYPDTQDLFGDLLEELVDVVTAPEPLDPNRPFPDFPPEYIDYVRLNGVVHRKERYWGGPNGAYVMHRCIACDVDWECPPVAACRRLGLLDIGAPLDEGDRAVLMVKVARANSEQALIEFTSMEGPYSIRVPVSELTRQVTS